MAVGDAYVFPCFLTPVLTQLFFRKQRLLFSHAPEEARGENTPERKLASTGDRTYNQQVMLTTEPPGRGWFEIVFIAGQYIYTQARTFMNCICKYEQ